MQISNQLENQNKEFISSISFYVIESLSRKRSRSESSDIIEGESYTSIEEVRGEFFSSVGPPKYDGNILESPNLVWTDDEWNEERFKEALERLKDQERSKIVNPFWKSKYENEAGSYWHKFYRRNSDHFYKDRHYLHIVFPELDPNHRWTFNQINEKIDQSLDTSSKNGTELVLLEVGCGVGNAIIPLIDIHPRLFVHAIDFAKSAIDILSRHPYTQPAITQPDEDEGKRSARLVANVCDVVRDLLPEALTTRPPHLILCMFVLSAIPPQSLESVLRKLYAVLTLGGKVLIRDYGRFDEAQLRFSGASKLSENFYVRQDGTCAYYFDIDELLSLCKHIGFEAEESYYIRRQFANRKQKVARYRVWIHVKLIKK